MLSGHAGRRHSCLSDPCQRSSLPLDCGLRGKVTEAYEMIPFADLAKPKGKPRGEKNRTRVAVLSADGSVAGVLDDESARGSHGFGLRTGEASSLEGAGVLIDCNGYGALIEFDEPREVYRGLNDTILIELAHGLTPAGVVGMSYRIVSYSGDPPALGSIAPESIAAKLLPSLDPVESLDALPQLLSEQPQFEVKNGDQSVASMRVAIAADDLALVAHVRDGQVEHNLTPWKGSCVEVFGSMPDVEGIGQVFLAPQARDLASSGYKAAGAQQVASPEIRTSSANTDGGYEIRAFIPLSLLRIDATKDEFLLEFQISTSSGKARSYHTLFGSKHAYHNSQRFGTFTVNEPSAKPPPNANP